MFGVKVGCVGRGSIGDHVIPYSSGLSQRDLVNPATLGGTLKDVIRGVLRCFQEVMLQEFYTKRVFIAGWPKGKAPGSYPGDCGFNSRSCYLQFDPMRKGEIEG